MKYEIVNAGIVIGMFKISMKLLEWWFEKAREKKSKNAMHIAADTRNKTRR